MNVSSCEEAQTFHKTYPVNLCIVGRCISLAAQGRSSSRVWKMYERHLKQS